jgi:hypothetical protein
VERRIRRFFNSGGWYADNTCVALPSETVGSTGLWMRWSKIPRQDVPSSMALGTAWAGPLLVRFGKRPRDIRIVDRLEKTVTARAEQRIARLRERGASPVLACLVQANSQLFDEKGPDNLPCMVVFSHDKVVTTDELHVIAEMIMSVKGKSQQDADLALMSDMVTNETAVMYRRRRIPARFTDDRVIYAADLWITRSFIAEGYLAEREYWCLAEPTDRGGIELLPQGE